MPKPNLLNLDKQLCLAEFLKITGVIVINKTDLNKEEADRIFDIYTKAGYKVIKIVAKEGQGIEELKEELKDNTSVLAGMSGVRKINNYKQIIRKE